MKILLTGSNGLLGQKLVKLITNQSNHDLIATARGKNRLTDGNYTFKSLDITKREEVDQAIDALKPDVIINTAAMTNVDFCEADKEGCDALNIDAVEHLIKACERNNTFLIHLSTDFIFDGENGPYDEEAQPNPLSYYGESKLKSEELVKASGIDWAIVRTVLVYGIAENMSRSNIILWVKKSLEDQIHINVVDDQWRTPTLAEDLAKGCLLIAEKKAKGVFNISGKDLLTPYEMAIKTADYFQLDKKYITKTNGSKFKQVAKRPAKTGFKLNKAVKELNYAPVSFEEGIAILTDQITD